MSEIIHRDEVVRVAAFFARRPKIEPWNSAAIQGKINFSLYEFSRRSAKVGIPVFCGLPLTKTIFDLYEPQCMWFHVDPIFAGDEPIFNVEEGNFCPLTFESSSIRPLAGDEVQAIVDRTSDEMPWGRAIEALTELYRRSIEDSGHFHWWGRNWHYRPMYFVIRSPI